MLTVICIIVFISALAVGTIIALMVRDIRQLSDIFDEEIKQIAEKTTRLTR